MNHFVQESTTMFRSIRQVRYLQRPFRHFSDVRVPADLKIVPTQEMEEKQLEKENMVLDADNEHDYLRQVSFKHAHKLTYKYVCICF